MLDLFRMEVEGQVEILNNNLLVLESNPHAATELEAMMRAAHSIKGAARIVQLDAAVKVAHVMEDCFVAAQTGEIVLDSADQIDVLLQGVDALLRISQIPEAAIATWSEQNQAEIDRLVAAISAILTQTNAVVEPEKDEDEEMEREVVEEFQNEHNFVSTSLPSDLKTHFRDSLMLDLFRQEVESHAAILNEGFLTLKANPSEISTLETLTEAAHVIKGAAQIVQIEAAVKVARSIENCLLAVREGKLLFKAEGIDILLQGINMLLSIAQVTETELETWTNQNQVIIDNLVVEINLLSGYNQDNLGEKIVKLDLIEIPIVAQENLPSNLKSTVNEAKSDRPNPNSKSEITSPKSPDRVVRVSAENLNRLMGLAGESLVEANWLQPFADSLLKLKRTQIELSKSLENLHESLAEQHLNDLATSKLNTARKKASECHEILSDRLNELELFARRSANLSDRLYREVIASHMRPFADGVQGFPRMMRDLGRQLGKQVKFEIIGKSTQVDRDILEKLEAPLTHILRNAIDHGIESPEDRQRTGKANEGTVRLEAAHRAGMLSITVSDDGRGVSLDRLRQKIIDKGMVTAEMADQLTETELMEFLFLPGFSTANAVTEISGRGVGLDVVQSMVQQVGGVLRAVSQPGKGMSFHLQLPLTLSVIRTLLVEISGEPYAFPLTRIDRIVMIPKAEVALVENRQYFTIDEQNIGLISAHQVLELTESNLNSEVLPAIIVGERSSRYGLVVDRFLGERDLVVRPLDPRLGKVPDISAVALMEDGSPVLIVDIEDMIRSIDKLLNNRRLTKVSHATDSTISISHKRVLVVDDSITVREVERKLLENQGYEVEVAVNGMDGWNAVRSGHYNLVITDVDMPRMNGIELVSQIKNHPNLKSLPVIIVSYKDREEDRIRGLEVGADYYLTKSSFHDDKLINAVIDLIGK